MPVRPYDQNQQFLLPPSLNEWVRRDHPARVFSEIIDQLDISGFREIKIEGRPCYEPQMMLKILLWSYANGSRASRKIEEKLYSDVVFMWLAGLEKPDFRTICLFRRDNLERLEYVFGEVILLSKQLGLLRLGLIALDGTKIRAHASIDSFKKAQDWSEELKARQEEVKRILAEAEVADMKDDAKYGKENRGDELPKGLEKTEARVKKIEALMKQIKGAKTDNNHRVSSTDPEAKFMHHKNGSMPAYNGELAVTEDQIIVHADVTNEPVDTNQLVPAVAGIENNCGEKPEKVVADAGFNSGKNLKKLEAERIEGYIAEGGEKNLTNEEGRQRGAELYGKEDFQYEAEKDCYICPAGKTLCPGKVNHRRTKYSQQEIIIYRIKAEVCSGCLDRSKCTQAEGGRKITRNKYEAERLRMREKLRTEAGQSVYKKRKTIVEPVIGQIKVVGGFVQFLLRGLTGAKIEWQWATIAHNILKLTRKIMSGEVKLSAVSA